MTDRTNIHAKFSPNLSGYIDPYSMSIAMLGELERQKDRELWNLN